MSAERIIGIDFGTSTSVVRVKRYENGMPVGDRLGTQAVTFEMGSVMVPTLIQRVKGSTYYGHDAQVNRGGAELFQNFKLDLESEEPALRANAKALTEEFFAFLGK